MFSLLAATVASKKGITGIILFWLVVVFAVQAVAPPLSEVTTNEQENFLPSGAESLRAIQVIADKFPATEGIPAILVVSGPQSFTPQELAAIERLDGVLRSDAAPEAIASVRSVYSAPQAREAFVAPDDQTMMLFLTVTGSPSEDGFSEAVDWVREQAQVVTDGTALEVAVTGPAGISTDAVKVFQGIDFRVTITTVALVLVILLAVYRSPLLALLPIVCVSWALLIAQSVAALLADGLGLPLNGQTTAVMSVLLFGAGTDFHTLHCGAVPRRIGSAADPLGGHTGGDEPCRAGDRFERRNHGGGDDSALTRDLRIVQNTGSHACRGCHDHACRRADVDPGPGRAARTGSVLAHEPTTDFGTGEFLLESCGGRWLSDGLASCLARPSCS